MYRLILSLFIFTLLLGQSRKSIHQTELEWHKIHSPKPSPKLYTGPARPLQPKKAGLSRTVFGYHPYWQGVKWQDYNYNLLSTIAYFSAEADGDGTLTDLNGWPATDLINKAHENGVQVVLVVTLFSTSKLETLLPNASYRQSLIDNLLHEVKRAGADGVNVDFEAFPSSQKNNMVTFIKDLTRTFHDSIPGSQVTLAVPAVDWSGGWDISALAETSDGLFIMGYDYHWKGSSTTGPVAPLTGGSYNVTNTVNTYLTTSGQRSEKLILGVPYYGYKWNADSGNPGANTDGNGQAEIFLNAEAKALSYGKLWHSDSQTPWYRYQSGGWVQTWYDDSTSLARKYDLALIKNLSGVGIWALGYDAGYNQLWDALNEKFLKAESPPSSPHTLSMTNMGSGFVLLDYKGAETADSILVKRVFPNTPDETTLGIFPAGPILFQDLIKNEAYYLKIQAKNAIGTSGETEVLGLVPSTEKPRGLIVNGFDRITGTTNTHDFIRQHGAAINSAGLVFDGASNEAVISGTIDLTQYEFVDWILGEEGTATIAFNPEEQRAVKSFLEGGGKLLVSGSEVGYALSEKGDLNDQTFYKDYLKASYISDAAGGKQGTYSATGVTGSFLEGFSFSFDDGTHGTYDVDWPDGIKPVGNAENILVYDNTDYNGNGGAGIAYRGWFGPSFIPGSLVYLSVGFESIYPEETRNELMVKILSYLDGPTTAVEGEIDPFPKQLNITSIYPNPSNSSVTIEFNVPFQNKPAFFTITDIRGRQVFDMQVYPLKTQTQKIRWHGTLSNGEKAPSGVYLANLVRGRERITKKFTLLK